MTSIRAAAVAGFFYPKDTAELTATVRNFIDHVPDTDAPPPKAIIAPHAGYVYSGAIAAMAYARLRPIAHRIRRVVLLGPCHRVAVNGLALSGADFFETPLGRVPLDKDAATAILDMPQVEIFDDTHAQEHSLEVHIPFLQMLLDEFTLVPLVVGQASADDVADVLERLWGGEETLIVVSSDLSHYLDYASAQAIDQRTCAAIENLDPSAIERDGACGRFPVSGLLRIAERRGMGVETVDLRNSGDTAGKKDKVVGYGSWIFTEGTTPSKPTAPRNSAPSVAIRVGTPKAEADTSADFEAATKALLAQHGDLLIQLAASSVLHGLDQGAPPKAVNGKFPQELRDNRACFVTLKHGPRLRGCIGSPQAHRPLVVDVVDNAFKSAFKDPRFKPLTAPELKNLTLSISVLSPQTPFPVTSQADLLAQLRPGIDGLVIADGGKRALFLPSVWEQLPTADQFLQHLKAKAGMTPDHWSDDFKAWRFIAEEKKSSDYANPADIWQGRA